MEMPKNVMEYEKEIFRVLWNFRKAYWMPEMTDGYWEGLQSEFDSICEKYQDDYLSDLLVITARDIERRAGAPGPGKRVVVELEPGARMPTRATESSGGFDLYCLESYVIAPGEMAEVRTGVHMQPPTNYVGFLFIRSGISKKGLCLSTGVSLIDADYTGEILAYVRNNGKEPVSVESGDRVCQICFLERPAFNLVEGKMTRTSRGSGGFGSTGK